MSIKVIIHGGLGRMGQACIKAVMEDTELQLLNVIDRFVAANTSISLPSGVNYFSNLLEALTKERPQVMIDFSIAAAAVPAIKTALENGVHVVSGTTGLTAEEINELGQTAAKQQVCFITAANFAIGAVLMMSFAKKAATYLERAEIIEMHHDQKSDAPSGTALATAQNMLIARPQGFVRPADAQYAARGTDYQGIAIHAVRLPGYLARQEVHFGTTGQTLTITHNTITRDCFMPGVILAVKKALQHTGLLQGLENVLNL